MYELPSRTDVARVVIDGDVVPLSAAGDVEKTDVATVSGGLALAGDATELGRDGGHARGTGATEALSHQR